MHQRFHLAQINIARLRYPTDDPRMAEFVNNLGRINALAERSPGFIWRLKDETGNALSIQAFPDPLILTNMSVWESPEDLAAFVYRTAHGRFVSRRAEWFTPLKGPNMALWWIAAGRYPEPHEGAARLAMLANNGSTAEAFSLAEVVAPRAA